MSDLRVQSWARVAEGCRVHSTVQDGNATFEFESDNDSFGFSMERSTIARLVELGTDALRRIDASRDGDPTAPCGVGTTSTR